MSRKCTTRISPKTRSTCTHICTSSSFYCPTNFMQIPSGWRFLIRISFCGTLVIKWHCCKDFTVFVLILCVHVSAPPALKPFPSTYKKEDENHLCHTDARKRFKLALWENTKAISSVHALWLYFQPCVRKLLLFIYLLILLHMLLNQGISSIIDDLFTSFSSKITHCKFYGCFKIAVESTIKFMTPHPSKYPCLYLIATNFPKSGNKFGASLIFLLSLSHS